MPAFHNVIHYCYLEGEGEATFFEWFNPLGSKIENLLICIMKSEGHLINEY